MEQEMTCKNCGCSIPYKALDVNFIVFCPACKEMMFLECEYGYGPVTPCSLYYRDKVVANVDTDEKHTYILKSSLLSETLYLKSRYLDALHEAFDIVKKLL